MGRKLEISLTDGKLNFKLWQNTIQDMLVQQGLDVALEDERPKEMKESNWTMIQKKAANTIRLGLNPKIKYSVLNTTLNALWYKLESIYASKSLTKEELYSLEMDQGGNLHDRMNLFKQLVC